MGVLKPFLPESIKNSNKLDFLIEENHTINELDVSDEGMYLAILFYSYIIANNCFNILESSNWMSFVRQAQNYNEQNLLISQEGNCIYFITTHNILPKQELKVGYSLIYAAQHKLPFLVAPEDKSWSCYECSAAFGNSEELQKHLDIHDDIKDENVRPKKKHLKSNHKKKLMAKSNSAVKCNDCNELFIQPGKLALRQHLIEKHLCSGLDEIDQYFSLVM